ncbi:MAG: endonuclease domain-containing protein [Bacteroidaceae bacterium]|nr:endonuclease domain-containing protein [Bacteroidaceae bacterium]
MLRFDEASVNYPLLKEYARQNRNNMTLAEQVLWERIRKDQIGHRFLRQYIIGNYIVDFVCRDDGLIIEVDGAYHSEPRQQASDVIREQWLTSMGYQVLRFTNEEVLYETARVIQEIIDRLK